jgi:hypothetical protein
MSMPEKMRPQSLPVQGPQHDESDSDKAAKAIHDRLASHRQAVDARHPDALRFGARFLATVSGPLHGAMTALAESWGYQREHLAAWLRGDWERSALPVIVLWQILTSPTHEAREAARALLRLLAEHLDYDLTPRHGVAAELLEWPARLYREGGDLAAAIDEASRDGRITSEERADLEARLRARDENTASIRATLAALPGGGR